MEDRGKSTTGAPSTAQRTPFEALFRRYYGPLVGFFLNRGLERADCEDLAQETLMSAYRGYDTFRGDASDATWIFTIAGNLWKNNRRDSKAQCRDGDTLSLDGSPEVRRETEVRIHDQEEGSAEEAMVKGLVGAEQRRELWKAIPMLPPQTRRALLLHLAGLKYREVAGILGVEVGTVKSLVSQAKMRLREVLRAERPDLFDGPAVLAGSGGGDGE